MKLKIPEILRCLVVMTALTAVTSIPLSGQSIVPGNMEIAGHAGVVAGIGTHGSFGVSLGAPITDSLILSGDLSYIPFGGANVTIFGTTTSSGSRAINFNGNLQYQFRALPAGVPYAGAGLGFLRTSFETSTNGPGPGPFNAEGSSTDLYFNIGGGFRHYVRERWGLRPELMIFAGSNTYLRFAVGIFYQFGE